MKHSIRMHRLFLPAVAAACLHHAPVASAVGISDGNGHVDVLPYQTGPSLTAGFYDWDLQQVVEDARLFARPMGVVGGDFFGSTNPGFTTFTDLGNNIAYNLPASTDLSFTIPTITGSDSIARNVLYWDGEGTPDFGQLPLGHDFYLRRSRTLNATLDGSSNPASGFSIETTNPQGEMHNHISYSARSNSSGQPDDGFYLFAMQLQVGQLSSDPIYFLFNADFERDNNGGILYNGDVPITNAASEQLTIDWVLASFLAQAVPGDTDGDGDIDDADLGTSFANYTGPLAPGSGGKSTAEGDTDGDGDVDDADLGTSFAGYTGPLGPAPVPEPGTAAALLLTGLFVARRRR